MLNIWPVPMTQRSHLFPFRTQKLSSVVPKILGWRRPGKIGSRRLQMRIKPNADGHSCFWDSVFLYKWPVGQAVKTAASHAANGSSILPRVTTYALLAQLVEQLTLNQRAQGSSPWKCTKRSEHLSMLAFLLVHFPPSGAASPFAPMVLRFSSQGISGKKSEPRSSGASVLLHILPFDRYRFLGQNT